jgi:hypothetical protein
MGMMPLRLTRPSVGFTPTIPHVAAGHTIEPSVSVPTASAARLAATAAPDPELDPHGVRSSAYGLRVCPPRALHPLDERVERKLAHSLRLVLPRRHGAGLAQPRGDAGVSRGRGRADEGERAGRGLHPVGGVDVVLEQHGDAVQRATHAPGPALTIEPPRLGERIGVDLDHRAQPRSPVARAVDGVDARQVRLRDRLGRVPARRSSPPAATRPWPRRTRTAVGGGRRRRRGGGGEGACVVGEAGDAEAGADEARGAGGAGMKEGASVHA